MFINATHHAKYLGVMTTSLYTIEGSRSGAIAASCYFGHKQLKPYYKSILEANLIGTKKLIEKIQQSDDFELYKTHGLGQLCFTSKNIQNELSKDRIKLITTTIESK